MADRSVFVHPTAYVSREATIGAGTRIWHQAQVREGSRIGRQCILGKGVYVDKDVSIGDFCKLQNGVFVFHGFDLEDGVFLGPGVMLLNDKHPRAINLDGSPKADADWEVSQGLIGYGAAVGGGAVILPGVNVGRMAVVGAGAVVTRNVPERGIVAGNPARLRGFACDCGRPLQTRGPSSFACAHDGRTYRIEEQMEAASTS
ncbi:MAG TPA: acyltransferase [Candidatus Dormibacteraeota bacterium]|nr:acyltransferase [Candidatus Dormibacteraeota bacterium]